MENLSLRLLLALLPYDERGRDRVQLSARALLLNSLKMQPHLHDLFFPTSKPHPLLHKMDDSLFPSLPQLGTAFVAEAISKVKEDFKFHAMIKKTEVAAMLTDMYASLSWKKLGFSLYCLVYPEVVMDEATGITLRDFIENEGPLWAERLVTQMMQPCWTKKILRKIITGQCTELEYNQEMNDLFIKLHLLDPQSVIPAYHFLLTQKALPQVNLELVTKNYLGGPLDWSLIKQDVLKCINTPSPFNVSRLSLDDTDVFYGVGVDEFVMTECCSIGFWSGRRPHNRKVSRFKDRCDVM